MVGINSRSDSITVYRQYHGGGSGYVYTSSTASSYPSGCTLNSTYYLTNASTTAGTSSFISPSGVSETGHSGNGYVRITAVNIIPTCEIALGEIKMKYIQLGTTSIVKVYMGSDLVFNGNKMISS
jgi:hypothetical protein